MSEYSYYPITHPEIEEYFTKHKNLIWMAEAVDLSGDRKDWENLNEETKTFIKFWLAFFSEADGIICENLTERFQHDTSFIKEVGRFYAIQNFMEIIHNQTYGNMIEVLIDNPEEKEKMRNAIKNYPEISKIGEWVKKWMNRDIPLLERVVAFTCVEGIFFTGAFCAIYWLKRQNIMNGLCQANEWIARDESLHTKFGVALYHLLSSQYSSQYNILPQEKVYEIVKDAMNIIEEFIKNALQVELIGINSQDMITYVRCTCDVLVSSLGYSKIYNVDNPFPWMLLISLPNKTNFFEHRVTDYDKGNIKIDYDIDSDCF